MSNTVVIIPSRLKARRLPNKPLKLINGKEMISHVYDLAKASNVGNVLVVTPDKEIDKIVKKKWWRVLSLIKSTSDWHR